MTSPYGVLSRITNRNKAPAGSARSAGQGCEMCSEPIAEPHQHVVNVAARQLLCVCRPCYLLFTDAQAELRYRAVPDRYLVFPDFGLDRRAWEALQIPVGYAFFLRNSVLDRTVAFYPSPAGAMESELDVDGWSAIGAADERVAMLAVDTEALLVRVPKQTGEPLPGPPECFLVPIDACYEFIGRLRTLWRGFDGGADARAYIDEFFAHVTARAKTVPATNSGPRP